MKFLLSSADDLADLHKWLCHGTDLERYKYLFKNVYFVPAQHCSARVHKHFNDISGYWIAFDQDSKNYIAIRNKQPKKNKKNAAMNSPLLCQHQRYVDAV